MDLIGTNYQYYCKIICDIDLWKWVSNNPVLLVYFYHQITSTSNLHLLRDSFTRIRTRILSKTWNLRIGAIDLSKIKFSSSYDHSSRFSLFTILIRSSMTYCGTYTFKNVGFTAVIIASEKKKKVFFYFSITVSKMGIFFDSPPPQKKKKKKRGVPYSQPNSFQNIFATFCPNLIILC